MCFIGVTTGSSASLRMFPSWAGILELDNARLVGIDLPLNAPAARYREVVARIKGDPSTFGALVTSHKIGIFSAAGELFDRLTDDSRLVEEVSCIYKRDGEIVGHATDPVVSGQAMQAILGAEYWRKTSAEVLCLGGGGAGGAIMAQFLVHSLPENRPKRILLVESRPSQVERLRSLATRLGSADSVEIVENSDSSVNDRLLGSLSPGSLVINATGMGKDLPGSPITDAAVFPESGVVWELNYRGDLMFLQQARRQHAGRGLRVEDGWHYFLLSWTLIVGLVFDVPVKEAPFTRLSAAAADFRGGFNDLKEDLRDFKDNS